MNIIDNLINRIKDKKQKILFTEGEDIRVLNAAVRLSSEGIITPVILGSIRSINEIAAENDINVAGLELINPIESDKIDKYVNTFCDIRKGRETPEEVRKLIVQPNYFGVMMLNDGEVDGVVSGAVYTSGEAIRPALQIIKTKPGVSRVSGAMLLTRGDQKYLYADIAVNISELDVKSLAEMAIESSKTAKLFDIDPKVAMLSFSTKGSANSVDSQRMAEATRLARELSPELDIDGELQFDAAIVDEIGQKKAPGSVVAGGANVFIFPDINSGNIAYKITQYLAGFEALGPFLQGLNKPMNDLSRGCTADDIYKVAIITAAQAID